MKRIFQDFMEEKIDRMPERIMRLFRQILKATLKTSCDESEKIKHKKSYRVEIKKLSKQNYPEHGNSRFGNIFDRQFRDFQQLLRFHDYTTIKIPVKANSPKRIVSDKSDQ